MKFGENTSECLYRWDYLASAMLLSLMALISFVNIISRYLFNFSLSFTEEVTINMFVWLTVIGSGIAFERCGHLGMVSLFAIFPRKMKTGVILLNALLGAILFVILDIILVQTVYREITRFHAKSPALGIPVWIYYAGICLLSPAVFCGIYRGCRKQLSELYKKEPVSNK